MHLIPSAEFNLDIHLVSQVLCVIIFNNSIMPSGTDNVSDTGVPAGPRPSTPALVSLITSGLNQFSSNLTSVYRKYTYHLSTFIRIPIQKIQNFQIHSAVFPILVCST